MSRGMKWTSGCLLFGALFLVGTVGCRKAATPEIQALAAEAPEEPSGVAKQQLDRNSYQELAERKLARLSGRISELRKAAAPRFPARSALSRHTEQELQEKLEHAEKQIFTLKLAPENDWQNFKEEVETALYDLEESYLNALASIEGTKKN